VDRRELLKTAGLYAAAPLVRTTAAPAQDVPRADQLRAIGGQPVLRRDRIADRVIIDRIELLKVGGEFLVRVRSREGAVGLAACNPQLMRTLRPVFRDRIAPFFIGKDARDLHEIQDALQIHQSNYKWQGLPFWAPHAWLELAILDLLGAATGLSLARLIGDPVRAETGLYHASGDRESSAAKVIEELRGFMAATGSKAVKYRLGARLRMTDWSTARDRELIPLARRELGDDAVLYVDANGSYDVPTALDIGRRLAEHRYAFFEEPVLFDDLSDTKAVADALPITIAGGEAESSLRRFEYMIANRVLDLVQPDLIYFGGITRAIRVARMAAAAGLDAVPHMSGGGLGFIYVLHFAAVVQNTLPHQEYKGEETIPYEVTGTGAPLRVAGGRVAIPDGPGLGVTFDPRWLARAQVLRA
jgi:D-galactarolactone cycloisomerase